MPVCPCSGGRQVFLDSVPGKDKPVVNTLLLVSIGEVSESEYWLTGSEAVRD